MIIDRKFKIKAVNPCNGKEYTEENAMLFCAKDMALIPALSAYRDQCLRIGCHKEHIDSINLLIERVEEFQTTIEMHKPDTHLDCEIERCIEGKNL